MTSEQAGTTAEQPPARQAEPVLGETLYDRDAIAQRVGSLGATISADYEGRLPVIVTVLTGATVFASDLTRAIDTPHEMDFLAVSGYDGGAPGDQVQVLKDLQHPIASRDVLLVEDVVDTGLTLRFLLRFLEAHRPSNVRVCTLLDRPHRRMVDVDIHYHGFRPPDAFYVGYGFDWRQRWRNLPDLVQLEFPE